MSRAQRDSDVQEDGEESVEGVVTYDYIILAEIELDVEVRQEERLGLLEQWFDLLRRMTRKGYRFFAKFPQGKFVGKQEQCKTKDG